MATHVQQFGQQRLDFGTRVGGHGRRPCARKTEVKNVSGVRGQGTMQRQ
ncbi:MAG: hypothetical protein IPI02_18580 [Sterolibacteriaceae bacterium]|nr:hypothetical protein [Sterolibacteriaceae bacterium]